MKLTPDDLAGIRHVQAFNFDRLRRRTLTGVSTDSRKIKNGDLFVALRGQTYDGHQFVFDAVRAGARAVVVEPTWFAANEAALARHSTPALVVSDTTRALGEVAATWRRKLVLPVIAVAGSNGKTTTKEMIARVLAEKYVVLATEGNLNNHIGVPLTLFRLHQGHEVAVVEIGTNHPGEIAALCEILQPTHGLITNIGHEHLEFFGDLEGVADAEGELFQWLVSNRGGRALAFLNLDDERLHRWNKRSLKSVSFGFHATNASVRGVGLQTDRRGCAAFAVEQLGRRAFKIKLAVPGMHTAFNALAAAAVGLTFQIPTTRIAAALGSFSAVGKRMSVLNHAGVTILDDTYNANPDSMIAGLQTLRAIQTKGKRIAVLADMLELGEESVSAHRTVGDVAGKMGIDCLLTYGPLSRHIHDAAEVKFKAHYDQKNVLAEYLVELVHAGDIVLVKGSRGMKMEDVVTFLRERLKRAA